MSADPKQEGKDQGQANASDAKTDKKSDKINGVLAVISAIIAALSAATAFVGNAEKSILTENNDPFLRLVLPPALDIVFVVAFVGTLTALYFAWRLLISRLKRSVYIADDQLRTISQKRPQGRLQ